MLIYLYLTKTNIVVFSLLSMYFLHFVQIYCHHLLSYTYKLIFISDYNFYCLPRHIKTRHGSKPCTLSINLNNLYESQCYDDLKTDKPQMKKFFHWTGFEPQLIHSESVSNGMHRLKRVQRWHYKLTMSPKEPVKRFKYLDAWIEVWNTSTNQKRKSYLYANEKVTYKRYPIIRYLLSLYVHMLYPDVQTRDLDYGYTCNKKNVHLEDFKMWGLRWILKLC